jgi:uncharacterized membrane protein
VARREAGVSAAGGTRDLGQAYKSTFLRGLATVLPTLLTLWVVVATWTFLDGTIAHPISESIKGRLVASDLGNEVVFTVWDELRFLRRPTPAPTPEALSAPERVRWEAAERERIAAAEPARRADLRRELDARFPGWVGFVLAIVAVFIVGFVMASFVGSSLWTLFEGWAQRIPLVKNIYPGAKQMVNFFLSGEENETFQQVVAIEFPRKGTWSIGFLTTENVPEIEAKAGEKVRGVYLGTPHAGQIVLAKMSEIVAVDMTIDEALKFLMSGGVIGRDADRPRVHPVLPWERKTTE